MNTTAPSVGQRRSLRYALLSQLRRNLPLGVSYVGAIIVFVAGAAAISGFASGSSVDNMLQLTAILAVVAGGQTLAILGGGIDLSVPWVMTGAGMLTSYLAAGSNGKLVWVIPLVLALAAGIGLGNGLGVTLLRIPPIVMTLAMNVIISGAVILYGSRQSAQAISPDFVVDLISGHVAGIPAYVFVLIATAVVFSALLSLTRYGRRLYAIGTSETVSRLSGVNVRNVTIVSYVLSSVASAIAGVLLLGYVNTAFFGMGDAYLFTSISAVVVGGASILGGSGHFIGTLGGALLLTVANALLVVLSLGPGAISIFYGLIILVSVIILSDKTRGYLRSQGIRVGRRQTPS